MHRSLNLVSLIQMSKVRCTRTFRVNSILSLEGLFEYLLNIP